MPKEVLMATWPVLLALTYIMAMSIMRVLAGHLRSNIAVHDLVRESKRRRLEYLNSLEARGDTIEAEVIE